MMLTASAFGPITATERSDATASGRVPSLWRSTIASAAARRTSATSSVVGGPVVSGGTSERARGDGRGKRGTERATRTGHLQVEPGLDRRGRVCERKPVGHDQTFEAP